MTFIKIWIGYAVVGIAIFSAVFLWAVRNGQFTDFDRARYIAIKDVPPGDTDNQDRRMGRIDALTWAGILFLAAAVLIWAVVIGARGG
ncbi:MAG: cbb3-type cytochrome oxidase assembly protein CcoS [Armatimonadetes bacterium]|nr:cbb3-type cytochrome oxidase assembly protein CcoS [Armatimonadota bacterium]